MKRAESEGDKEKKRELFRNALGGGKKKGGKRREGRKLSPEEEGEARGGVLGGRAGGVSAAGGEGHKVDVLA